ncbi:hypothetical protein KIL84_013155 [Mauremys mutica]|uniref:Uncharacterized protein n=1 Tax=Mauremys mutica TaxID=74926 RepID=A0A9D3WX78_9SAUR|nr:hypothetical protein KIL84_013155 [Mauremys mutica]
MFEYPKEEMKYSSLPVHTTASLRGSRKHFQLMNSSLSITTGVGGNSTEVSWYNAQRGPGAPCRGCSRGRCKRYTLCPPPGRSLEPGPDAGRGCAQPPGSARSPGAEVSAPQQRRVDLRELMRGRAGYPGPFAQGAGLQRLPDARR